MIDDASELAGPEVGRLTIILTQSGAIYIAKRHHYPPATTRNNYNYTMTGQRDKRGPTKPITRAGLFAAPLACLRRPLGPPANNQS